MKTQQQIEQELSLKPFAFQQKVEACKTLYIAYQGRHHDHIQLEMRKLGNDRWNNRCLYARVSRGKYLPGWPERFGWDEELRNADRGSRIRARKSRHLKLKARSIHTNPHSAFRNPQSGTPDFHTWLKSLSGPYNWDWKFQRYVIEKLEAFERGDTKRLMLFVPPRHGKSELVTVRYAAWHLQQNPKSNIIIGSYNQKLANRFSRRIKNVYAEAQAIAAKGEPPASAGGPTPDTATTAPTHDQTKCGVCIAKAQECPHARSSSSLNSQNSTNSTNSINSGRPRRANTDAEWETPDGGGVKAVGCGAGITGFGANLIIIDDPVKSRSEAESQTIRDKVFDWFNDDIYTRLEPDGKMILIQTRWHEDDLAGRLLREMQEDEDAEQWEVINFPAIAEPQLAVASGQWPVAGGADKQGPAGGNRPPGDSSPTTDHRPLTTAKPIYYIRNGQHYPIHTLGDPNKRRGSDPATFPPIELATAPPHRTAERLCLSDRPALDSTELAKRATDPRHSLKTIESDATGEASLTAVHGGIADRSASSPHSQNSPHSRDCPHSPNSQDSPHSRDSRPTPKRDPLGRLPGDALCPQRYPIERLMKTKKRLGTYSFTALYQQRPIPAEGGFFKRHWFKIVDHIPPGLKWKRGYDLGISASPGADYTATARVAFDGDGNMYIDRVLRRRMEYPEQRRAILGLIATEHDTEHFIEKSANGNAVIQDLRRERGISERHFRGVEVRESKTARAFTWNALAEEGRVHLIRAAWNTDFIDEACSFPGGVNDDQIDAVSIAVKILREETRRGAHGF